MKKYMMTFLRDDEGLTVVEYAVAAALVSAAVIAAFTALGGNVAAVIQGLANIIGANIPAA